MIIDWENWRPGNSSSASISSMPSWLQEGLTRQGISFPGAEALDLEELCKYVSIGLGQGSAEAKIIKEVVSNLGVDRSLAKSLVHFAVVLAQSQNSLNSYLVLPGTKIEWDSANCCEVCKINDGKAIAAGEVFPSGHYLPPACAYCICEIIPFFDD